jgi:hypothetical protein
MNISIKYKKLIFAGFLGFTLANCNITNDNKNARIETAISNVKISNSLRSYNKCVEDGKSFDSLAATKNEEAESLYNKSARILNDCDFIISDNPYIVNEKERMKNYALSIQNYIKAGNLIQASLNFRDFQKTFDKDLTYKDGSSFAENIETILTYNETNGSGAFALVNNSRSIRKELKRIKYWSKK